MKGALFVKRIMRASVMFVNGGAVRDRLGRVLDVSPQCGLKRRIEHDSCRQLHGERCRRTHIQRHIFYNNIDLGKCCDRRENTCTFPAGIMPLQIRQVPRSLSWKVLHFTNSWYVTIAFDCCVLVFNIAIASRCLRTALRRKEEYYEQYEYNAVDVRGNIPTR